MGTREVEAAMEDIQVEHMRIAGFPALIGCPAKDTGRPPVVLLHGAFADEHGFEGWVRELASAGYHTYAPARRGRSGIGPDRAAGLSFDDYVDDCVAVLAAVGERHPERPAPIVVGHSLGGLLAQRLAEMGRTSAVVLVASAPPAMLTAQAVALPRFARNVPRIMAGQPFIVPPGACSVLALNRMPEPDRPRIHAHLTHESGKVYRAMMFGSVRIDASRVRVPVLVVGGDDDRIISTRLLRKTARHYGTEPVIHVGRGHWLIEEPGWERLVADIATWLDDVGGQPLP